MEKHLNRYFTIDEVSVQNLISTTFLCKLNIPEGGIYWVSEFVGEAQN